MPCVTGDWPEVKKPGPGPRSSSKLHLDAFSFPFVATTFIIFCTHPNLVHLIRMRCITQQARTYVRFVERNSLLIFRRTHKENESRKYTREYNKIECKQTQLESSSKKWRALVRATKFYIKSFPFFKRTYSARSRTTSTLCASDNDDGERVGKSISKQFFSKYYLHEREFYRTIDAFIPHG